MICWLVICLEITRFELERFTKEIFCFGNSVNIPDPSIFWIKGAWSLNGEDVEIPEAKTAPALTPVWTPTAANVSVLPSTDISVILLKTLSSVSPLW